MSHPRRPKKGNMQTRVEYNAREQSAAPKQLESQEKAEDWESECPGSTDCVKGLEFLTDNSALLEKYNNLYITHRNYQKATKAQITSLTRKLKETERKLSELQKCFLSADNSEDTIVLMSQLLESQNKVKELEADITDYKNTIKRLTEDHLSLGDQFSNHRLVSERTINELKEQLAEARSPRNLQAQSSQPAAELSAEPSRRATKASQADFRSAKEADLELKCGKQQAQIHQLQQRLQLQLKQFNDNKVVSERTINELKKQLAEFRSPRNLKEQSTAAVQTAAELSAEPSRRATKASQADFRSAKEADLELKCGKQQAQIHQVQQQLQLQLQESQRQLEEQAIQHRQEREKFQSEMNEVKSLLTNYKNLHAFYVKVMEEQKEEKSSMGTPLEKAEAEKEFLPQTVEPLQKKQDVEKGKEGKVDLVPQTSSSLQEPAEEKQSTEQEKEVPQTFSSLQEPNEEKQSMEQEKAGKGDSLLETVRSLQESLKTRQENEKILTTKLEKLEEQSKQKKKKKRNWLLRLFSRIRS